MSKEMQTTNESKTIKEELDNLKQIETLSDELIDVLEESIEKQGKIIDLKEKIIEEQNRIIYYYSSKLKIYRLLLIIICAGITVINTSITLLLYFF